uniref:EF-hand domain-containing protein n=1 Tax=Strigamia maritima TaxID=126957 RepID=T1IR01_STRMM
MLPGLFYKLGLFPSKSQIHEMLHCASDCSDRCSANCLSFGEFCVFSSELKNCYENQTPRPTPLSKISDQNGTRGKLLSTETKSNLKYEVFLGGSCNPTTWRQNIAIPLLKKWRITYYNPQVGHWKPELIELENQAKENAEVLFFVIDNQTRSVASVIEAAHIAGCQKKLILVVKEFQCPGQMILGEPLSEKEFQDLCHGQAILQDVVERQGIPVFDDIHKALECTARLLREGLWPQDLTLKDNAQPVCKAHVQLGDKLIKVYEAFNAMDTSNSGLLGLNDVKMAFRILTNYDLTSEDLDAIIRTKKVNNSMDGNNKADDITVTFDQFCCIVSEFKNKSSNGRCILKSIIVKTANVLNFFILPLFKMMEWIVPRRRIRLASHQHDVYLGGSCDTTSWREDIAIPILRKTGLTFFNPQTNYWSGNRFTPIEATAIDNCRVLLFVITNTCRSLSTMAIAAHYIGLNCKVVLCIQYLPENCIMNFDRLSVGSIKDYNRGRTYLSDLANRENIPVFDEIDEAVQCVVDKCKLNT